MTTMFSLGVCNENKVLSMVGLPCLSGGEVVRCSTFKGVIHLTDVGRRWVVCESKG